MRGWLHAYAFFVAVVAGVVLTTLAATVAPHPGWAPAISCAIYSVTVCALFGTSALYHRRGWSPRPYHPMRRVGPPPIFLFFPGAPPPLSGLLLSPPPPAATLGGRSRGGAPPGGPPRAGVCSVMRIGGVSDPPLVDDALALDRHRGGGHGTPAVVPEPQGEQQADQSGDHQNVPDNVETDPAHRDVYGER